MERILVGIDSEHPALEALIRALCLAARINARVCVLVVHPPGQALESNRDRPALRLVESEIDSARTAGTSVEVFVAEGDFDRELIETARRMKTTFLVASAVAGDEPGGEREAERLTRILHGVDCRVELVSPKKNTKPEKEGP